MLRKTLIEIIKVLNDNVTDNPEYLRGQLEMANALLGVDDDGYHEKLAMMLEVFPKSTLAERKAAA